LLYLFSTIYVIFQNFIAWIFGPSRFPSKSFEKGLPKKKIAIIGAGLTGISSAAHCISHGFEVQIFEARGKAKGLGGI
jgi:NADPH-dependent 2,4-dienoyl-CoA reductase/sulfur reductase-like enzyme